MHYVTTPSSSFFGKLVGLKDGLWVDHLGNSLPFLDFNSDHVIQRPEVPDLGKKINFREITDVLTKENCNGFYHFMDISNIPRFFERGFVASRSVSENNGLSYRNTAGKVGANHVVKGEKTVRDYARFTVQSANPILYRYQGLKLQDNEQRAVYGELVPQPCILRMNYLMATLEDVLFSRTNANSGASRYFQDVESLKEIPIKALQSSGGTNKSTFDRGAELLYPSAAPINLLDEIYFRSVGEFKQAHNLTQGSQWHQKMVINKKPFPQDYSYTYLVNAILGNSNAAMDGTCVPDQTAFNFGSKIDFRFVVWSPYNYDVNVDVYYGGNLVSENHQAVQLQNIWNLATAVTMTGNYRVDVTLTNREQIVQPNSWKVYSVNFQVS